jgi:MSHA biogenesis protein MshI
MRLPQLSTLFKRSKRDTGLTCLALGEDGVHLVQVQHSGAMLQVSACAFFPMGEITSLALEKLVKEQRLVSCQFTTLLAPDEYQILMVDAPNVPADELKMAIRYRIKDSLNYRVEDAMVDVVQIPGNKNTENRPQSLYAIAASNDTIQARVALFENAGIELAVIDIPEMAQRNIAALFESPRRGLATLTFDTRGGLLIFTCDGELYLSRRLEITAGQLQDANASRRQQYFDRVELEVQRSLDYFDQQFHLVALERMLICVPDGVKLVELLANSLDLPVERLDLARVMDISAVPALQDSEFLAAALLPIGAALRQEGRPA